MKDEERMRRVLSPELAERVRRLSDETLVAVLDAFREGRRSGAERARAEALARVDALLAELEARFRVLDPERCSDLEVTYGGAASPLAAAHFGGAGDVLLRLRSWLERGESP